MNPPPSFDQEFERAKEDLDKRLASKHVRTLNYLQEKSYENDRLRHRVSELEGYKMKSDYYATLEKKVQTLQVREEISQNTFSVITPIVNATIYNLLQSSPNEFG
jgi:DNA repair ATPase RecN